jgi:molybdenum cofactor guanylyltransferase
MTRLAGVVLAGGRSSRFGRDKAEEPYRGRKLIEWSIAALTPHCDPIFIGGRDYPPYHAVADHPRNGLGPLGGLAGALLAAADAGSTRMLSLPCDMPQIPDALLRTLRDHSGPAYLVSCPVAGIWTVDDCDALQAFMVSGARHSMRGWAEAIGATAIPGFDYLPNINRLADLVAADGE